jgi:hypothetical protein
MSAIESAAGLIPKRWNGRRQRYEDLVRGSMPGYHALQLHRIIEGASS